ncbi:sister chromatid cohesion protein PDS5-like protein isoform X1 [Tanacetum coccineum]
MLDALKPSMKVLIQDDLLRHSDVDVKVAVASCISQITRITAPDAPYDDDQMRLTSPADLISEVSILETVSRVQSCVIMLDLECDGMIVEMFEHFLRSVRDYHRGVIYSSMENIMILVLEESEDISVEMLKPLLATVKKHIEGVLPIAQKLGEEVLKKSAEKLKPYLMPALTALGDSLDSYTEIVTRVCEGTTAAMKRDDENDSGQQPEVKRPATIDSSGTSSKRKRKRKRTPVKDKDSDTIKYDGSLVAKNVKVWWPEDKMYYEGVIESFE